MLSEQMKSERIDLTAYGFSVLNQGHLQKIWNENLEEVSEMEFMKVKVQVLIKQNHFFLQQDQGPVQILQLNQRIQFEILLPDSISENSLQNRVQFPIYGFSIRNTATGSALPLQSQDTDLVFSLISMLRKIVTHYTINLRDHYSRSKKIYTGKGVSVFLVRAKNEDQGQQYAIKSRVKKQNERNSENRMRQIKNEISNLKNLNHENIVKFRQVCQSNNSIYIVTEFLQGPTLQQYIRNTSKVFSYQDTKLIAEGVLKGLQYMHHQGLAHRDIKPDNIILNSFSDPKPYIIDFGFSEFVETRQPIHTFCGTPSYISPECFIPFTSGQWKIHTKSDIFSFGICLFELLFKQKIFKLPTSQCQITPEIMMLINKQMNFHFPDLSEPNIRQTQLIDLIKKMVQIYPSDRISADEALRHPFFREIESETSPASTKCSMKGITRKTKQIHKTRENKK